MFWNRKPAPKPTPPVPPIPVVITPGVLFGVATETFTEVAGFETDAGRHIDIYSYYQSFYYDTNFNAVQAQQVQSHGSLPMITWEPWDPRGAATANQPKYALSTIVQGNWDVYITRWATQIKAYNGPILLRFAHEMNGDWYPWGMNVNGNSLYDYVKAWQHVRSIFDKAGVTNVKWVWSPNVDYLINLSTMYPGDALVDWIAIDGYNWGGSQWQAPDQIFGETIDAIRGFTQKPIMIGETGSPEAPTGSKNNKRIWIQQFFQMLKDRQIGAFVWFNYDKEEDWRIESTPAAMTGFASALKLM